MGNQSMGMVSKATQEIDGGTKAQNQGTECSSFTSCFPAPDLEIDIH